MLHRVDLSLACNINLIFCPTVHLVVSEVSLKLALKSSTKGANDNVQSGDHGEGGIQKRSRSWVRFLN